MLKWYLNRSLRVKLLIALLFVGLMPAIMLVIYTQHAAAEAMREMAARQLIGIRESRASQITDWFAERQGNITYIASQPLTISNMRATEETFAAGHPQMAREAVAGYGTSEYSLAYLEADRQLRAFMETYGYYDVFLIDIRGSVVFSVTREADFATNLRTGNYRDTDLAEAFEEAMRGSGVYLTTVNRYSPSNDIPAMFISYPIMDGSTRVGVLAAQIPLGALNEITTMREGLGDSGESYIVKTDGYLMATPSRFITEEGGGVLSETADHQTVKEAAGGKDGAEFVPDYLGIPVLSAYQQLSILNQENFALITEIWEDEILSPVHQMTIRATFAFFPIIILISLISLFIRAKVVQPDLAEAVPAAGKVERAEAVPVAGKVERAEAVPVAGESEVEKVSDQLNALRGAIEALTSKVGKVEADVRALQKPTPPQSQGPLLTGENW